MEKGNHFVYKPVFSVSSSVTSQIYMNMKLYVTSKLLKVCSSSSGCCRQLTSKLLKVCSSSSGCCRQLT